MNLDTLFTVVQAFANNSHVPRPDANPNIWTSDILPAILSNKHLTAVEPNSHIWLQFTLQLMTLGHFEQKLITRVLKPAYLNSYLNRKHTSSIDINKVFILYQTAAMNPNISLNGVDKKFIEGQLHKYSTHTICPIQKALLQELNADFFLINVKTKYSHWIPTLMKINTDSWTFQSIQDNFQRDENGFVAFDDIKCGEKDKL